MVALVVVVRLEYEHPRRRHKERKPALLFHGERFETLFLCLTFCRVTTMIEGRKPVVIDPHHGEAGGTKDMNVMPGSRRSFKNIVHNCTWDK